MSLHPLVRSARAWPAWLPRGGSLPDAAWESRHRAVCTLLLIHLVLIPLYALGRGNSLSHSLFEAIPLLTALVTANYRRLGRAACSSAAALGLMTCAAELVHLSNGLIEAHFYFFVMIPVVAMYEAWLPFALGVGYVVIHHGLIGTLEPHSVYNHQAAWTHPWIFALVHGLLFAFACVACVVNWWLHERARQAESSLVRTLAHQGAHDDLTDLPNRAAFLAQGAVRERAEGDSEGTTAVLMLDLDRFKEVNDTLGHSFGDHLLRMVSERLHEVMRHDQLLARLGGDEFAVLLRGLGEAGAVGVAQSLRDALHENFVVDGMLLNVDVSVGIATASTADGCDGDLEALLRQAEVAMYAAKRSRNGVEVYDPKTDEHTLERLTLLTELRRGLDRKELVMHYQPKVSLIDQTLTGLEALVRWEHPERGLIPPSGFIPAAEHTALIVTVTRYVLDSVLEQLQHWLREGRAVQVAVNVAPRCVLEPDFPREVLESLERRGVPAEYLRLEITESTLLIDPERALAALTALSDAGVSLSIDDFGTGYSSMSYLSDLPIDELKIDRSFVTAMLERRKDDVLVSSVIDLGHSLGLSVVAEGVETADVLASLTAKGCDVAQGFLLSRPVPAADLPAWLEMFSDRTSRETVAAAMTR